MLAAWMAWPDPGGRRGQVRRAAAGTGPDPVSGSGDSGGRAEADFFIKKYICPGSIAIGTKDLTHLSRIGCPGWKTGTKDSSKPGLHALSIVVGLTFRAIGEVEGDGKTGQPAVRVY